MIPTSTILDETGRALARMRPHESSVMQWFRESVVDPLGNLFAKLFSALAGLAGLLGGKVLLVLLFLAAAVLLATLAHMVFRRGQARTRARAADQVARSAPVLRDPDEAERDAARLAREGRFTEAVRCLYLATFVRLHRRSGRPFDPSLTPGENLRPFRREPWFPRLRAFTGGYLAASFGEARLDDAAYRSLEGSRPPEGAA